MKKPTCTRALSILLAASALSFAAHAGEGFKTFPGGKSVRLAGYGTSPTEVYAAPAIRIDVNTRAFNGSTFTNALPGEIQSLSSNLAFAMGLWENIPHTRLNFTLGSQVPLDALIVRDNSSVATLREFSEGELGGAIGHLSPTSPDAVIIETDVAIQRSLTTVRERAVLVHELGHGVGFNHSWLNERCVESFAGPSSPSIMSQHEGPDVQTDPVTSGALGPDDVALTSRLYPTSLALFSPALIRRLSRTCGTIQGRLFDSNGVEEIRGANVLVVSPTDGAIVSRISGYESTKQLSQADGFFSLDGVPPGRYDVLLTSKDDPFVPRHSAVVFDMVLIANGTTAIQSAESTFESLIPRTWVRDVEVEAGETFDLGMVLAGEDRQWSWPTLVDVTETGPYGASYYWFDFWSYEESRLVERSGVLTQPTYSTRLRSQNHAVRMYGWNGSSWQVLQNWTYRSYVPRMLELTWTRATRLQGTVKGFNRYADALSCFVNFRPNKSGSPYRYATVDGDKYTSWVAGGEYIYRVIARWNSSETSLQQNYETKSTF